MSGLSVTWPAWATGLFSDWILYYLRRTGLFQKKTKVLILGLDNAGKATMLHIIRNQRITLQLPTPFPNREDLSVDSLQLHIFDVGGYQSVRSFWKEHFPKTDGVIFIVDCFERERFPEAKHELEKLLCEPALADVPTLVLGNKIDKPTAASESELREALNLNFTTGKTTASVESRAVEVFMCSIVQRFGFDEGLQWLSDRL